MSGINQMLLALGGDVLNIIDQTVTRLAATGTINAKYQLTSGGRIFFNTSTATDATSDKGPWVTPNGSGSNYECFATMTVGSVTTGTTGAWVDLATSPTWTRQAASLSGDNTCTFTLDLRLKGTTTTLKTVTITLDANSS